MFRKVTDTSIIEGIRQQDDKTLNWLYDNFLQTVRHHVLKNSGSEADVSDVFQESIITLYRQISENNLQLTSDLKAYFFGIARNIWSVQLRHKRKLTELEIDFPAADDDIDELTDPVLERIISRALQKLKPDAREILILFSEGYSYEEIARIMNLKSDTYARRKKYLSKETLIELVKADPEYSDYHCLRK